MMKNFSKKQFIIFGVLLLVLLAEHLLHAQLSNFLEKRVRAEVAKRNIGLEFTKIDYGYLPPRLLVSNISYKNPSTILTAKKASASIQVLPLLKGQAKLGSVIIQGSNVSHKMTLTKDKNSKEILSLEKVLNLIPMEEISILNSKTMLLYEDDVLNLEIETAKMTKLYQKIQLEFISLVKHRTPELKTSFYLNTKLRWQESGFFISFFNLQKENSIAELSGAISDEILTLKKIGAKEVYDNVTELRAKINVDLLEFNDPLVFLTKDLINPKSPIQNYSGRVQASGYYYQGAKEGNTSTVSLKADGLKTPFVKLKSLNTKGELGTDSFTSEALTFKLNDRSQLDVESLKLKKQNSSFFVSVNLKTKEIHVEDVLSSLNLKAPGLHSPVSLDTHCGGVLTKQTLIKCKGSGSIKSLNIKSPSDNHTIFSLNKISNDFKTSITKKSLEFSSNSTYEDPESGLISKGTSSGSIDFITGFDVKFETEPINLSLVNEISGQKFTGLTALKGTTRGSSKWGTISAKLKSTDFKFNDLFLGKSNLNFKYKFPNLSFKNIKGEITEDSNFYNGSLNLNVAKKDLVLKIKGSSFNELGAKTLFADMFSLPDAIKFESDFKLNANDGLDLNTMTLDLVSNMKNLNIFGEFFKKGKVHLNGPKGNWLIKEAFLNKENSSFRGTGSFEGFKFMDVSVTSDNFDLQESDFLKTLNIKTTGPAKIKLHAKGPIEGPKATGTATLTNTKSINNENLGGSDFTYRLFQDYIDFKGHALNKAITGEGSYPFEENKPFVFNGLIKRFNLLDFLSLNAENSSDTKLYISVKPDLKMQKGVKASGNLENTYIELVSEGERLALLKQTKGVSFDEDINFELIQDSYLANLGLNLSKNSHSIYSFNGHLKLDIFKPFIPTCEYIGGVFESELLEIKSYQNKIVAKGNGQIKNSRFKTEAFPYSFNKIKSNVSLIENSINFNQTSAAVANTQIKGSGKISLLNNGPYTNFELNYNRLNVEFPPKITTESTGRLSLTGSKFPLLLSGKVTVHEGVFAQDILDTSSSETVSPNKFLPSKILKTATPPAVLDVSVVVKNKMAVRTNEADGFVYGSLKATGNPADPLLKGLVTLVPQMKINFNDKVFRLNEGTLQYNNTVANDPKVFIDASSDVIDTNNPLQKSYAIRTLIKGEGTKQSVKFTSQPSLEENQIISLLTIGTISTESLDQEITTTEQATYSGLQFGSYLVQKNQALKDLQKQTGTQIGLTSSINSGGVNPTVVVKKSWTPKASSTLSQSFGNQKNLALANEYKLNEKTSTVFKIQNNQTDDASQLINRRVQQGVILDLGLQYKFEFQ